MSNKLRGAILAAGKGSRVDIFGEEFPKPLLPVCNKPILQYQIELMRDNAITEIAIVVGHLKKQIIDYFGDGSSLGVAIEYVEQQDALGIAHAVGQLEGLMDRPFLLFLGDIFSAIPDLDRLLARTLKDPQVSVLAVRSNDTPENIRRNFAVTVGKDNRAERVVEKPRHVEQALKGVGIYLFALPIFDAIRRTPRTAMRDEYEITNSIQILIDDGYAVYAEDVVKWDLNLTYIEDLLECNLRMMSHQGEANIIPATAVIPDGCTIENSVIGDDVVIENPIRITNSLILPHTHVRNVGDLVNSLKSEKVTMDFSGEPFLKDFS
ncbi:MAG: NTP transferase domain-containing protein [Candidatus Eisenbacteria sp.]|nr:NTP transferase domain-containing protein [Candidatus Eisenbacteria bacterium]